MSLIYRVENIHNKLPFPLYKMFEWYIPDLRYRYLTMRELLQQLLANKSKKYKIFSHKEILDRKKSDTLFICGSSGHVDEIDEATWDKINEHDTLGLNYFIYHKFSPTYYALNYGRNDVVHTYHEILIKNRNRDYENTIFLVSSRMRRRGIHPRITPQFFTNNPKVAYFLYPRPVRVPASRSFRPDDFKKSIFYRGSLNNYLYVARLFEYRKIVLLGCEMDSGIPFYEHYPEAQWMSEMEGYQPSYEERLRGYMGLTKQKGKHNLITTILAINEYVFEPEGLELYVFNKKSLLYPTIPLYRL